MLYFVVRVKYLKNGQVKKSELMDYNDKQAALAKFHQNIGADMADDTLAGSFCTVLSQEGKSLEDGTYYWHIPEPEPVQVETEA